VVVRLRLWPTRLRKRVRSIRTSSPRDQAPLKVTSEILYLGEGEAEN
jgi:hypothetical protein